MAAAMAARADAAAAGTRDAAQEIRLRVIEAYRQAEMAGRAVEVTERVRDVAQAREAEIEARVETGGALKADLLRARARRREREADLAERRGQQRDGPRAASPASSAPRRARATSPRRGRPRSPRWRATRRRGSSGRCASGPRSRWRAARPTPLRPS